MEFTPTGDIYVLITVCGAFVAAFLLSLLPLARKTRMRLVFAGPVGAVAGILFGAPGGLDGVFWTIVAGYGVLAWSGGLAVGYLVHRGFTRVRAARCGRGCLDWSRCAD
jgi:CBS-domain-containing membrane protein